MKKILLLFFLISVRLMAQADAAAFIYKGLDYSYNFQLREAGDSFQNLINKYPSDPRGYHYKSGIYLWLYMSNKNKNDFDKFVKLSDIAIAKAKAVLENNDRDENALYVLGANYGFRAMAFMKANNSMDAVWAAKSSNSYLNKTLEYYPRNNDAYLGKGLFSYGISYVPGVFKWALSIAGISGSKEEGINFLKKAYKYGKYSKTEAAYYLSQVYSDAWADYKQAGEYLSQIIKKYPHNCLFRYSYAVVLMKDRKVNEAAAVLHEIIKENNPEFRQVTAYSNFLMADVHYRKNEFSQAIAYYQKFLSTTTDFDYSGIAYFRTAISYEMTGNRMEAQHNLILARNGNIDLPDDAFAKKKSEYLYDHPPTENQKMLIRLANSIEAGKFNEAWSGLNALLPKLSSDAQKAEALVYLSDCSTELGRYSEAIDFASRAVKLNYGQEKWVRPFAYYYGALAAWKNSNNSLCKSFLNSAAGYSGYDYEEKLTGLIKALQGRL